MTDEPRLTLRRKVISASIILGGLVTMGRMLDLVATLLVARLIAPEAFGIVAAALVTYQLALSFTELNISAALIQRTDIKPSDYDAAFTFSLLRGLLVTSLMIAAAVPMAMAIGNRAIVPVVAVLGLAQFAAAFRSPRLADYLRDVRPARPAMVDFIGRLSGFVMTITLALITGSYWSIVAGMIFTQLISALVSYIVAPYRPRWSLEESRWLLSFSGWINLHTSASALQSQFDRLYIGSALGQSALAIYTVATSIATQLVWSMAAPLMNALFAGFASIKEDKERLTRAYLLGQQVIVAIMMPVGVGLALTAAPLIRIFLSEDWMAAAPVVAIVAPATAFNMMAVGSHSLAMALGHPKKIFFRSFISLLVNIVAVFVAVSLWAFDGAAIARAFSVSILVLLNLHLAKVLLGVGITRQFVNCFRTFAACLGMALAVIALLRSGVIIDPNAPSLIGTLILAAIGAIIYTLSHAVFWLIAGKPGGAEEMTVSTAMQGLKKLQRR